MFTREDGTREKILREMWPAAFPPSVKTAIMPFTGGSISTSEGAPNGQFKLEIMRRNFFRENKPDTMRGI